MIKDLVLFLVLIVLEVGVWLLGKQFGIPLNYVIIAMVALAVLFIIIYLVLKILAIRRSMTIEKKLADQGQVQVQESTDSGRVAQADMQKQFQSYLQALKASPTGKGSLATLPWFLVIGAPGSGKTTALQESGLAFSSMGHGVRSIRGIGGTRNCDWWFTDNAIFLDTAGRYTTQPEDQPEWFSFLDLIRETRKGHALNGIVVVVSVADLVKSDASNLAATVRPIRERIMEVSTRLHLVLPVYVVFSKADMMGGFKDFFSYADRGERDQIWGCTLTRAETAGKSPREIYAAQVARMLPALQIRRLAAASGDRPKAQIMKACLFIGNFVATQKWFGEFIGELFAPNALPDQPVFRGFYFTSGIQVQKKEGEKEAPKASAQTMAPPRTDLSIFFSPEAPAPVADVADQRRGFFLKNLFARVVINDRGLAALPSRLVRRARIWRFLAVYGSLVLGLILLVGMVIGFIADRRDIARATDVCTQSIALYNTPDLSAKLTALDAERVLLEDVAKRHSGTARDLAARIQEIYYPQVAKLFTDPAMARMASQIEQMRRASNKSPTANDQLFDLLRGYQMLGGSADPDARLLTSLLKDQEIWYSGLEAAGPLSADVQRTATHQLDYLLDNLTTSKGWQGRLDQALVERVSSTLGDALWVQQSYSDVESSVQGSMGKVDHDFVFPSDDHGLLTIDADFSTIYTKEGWDSVFKSALEEKAGILVRRYQDLNAKINPNDIKRQMRALYVRKYNEHWLNLIKTTSPARAADLTEASNRLRTLTQLDSTPYLDLIKTLKTAADMKFDDVDSRVTFTSDGKWLTDGLTSAKDLQKAVDDFLNATQKGTRFSDPSKLTKLAAAADTAAAAFDTATSGLDDTSRDACRACLGNLIDSVRLAANIEAAAELDRAWQDTVTRPIASQLAGKFPLVATSTLDCPIAAFDGVFNPRSGSFWVVVKSVEDLRKVRFAGTDFLSVGDAYQRMQTPAHAMADCLFSGGSETMTIPCIITLDNREGVKDINFAIGDQKFRLYDRPDRRAQLIWKQNDPAGAKISIQLATGQWMTKDQPAAAWGILRLLRDGAPVDRPEGDTRLNWSFDAAALGKRYNASAVLDTPALEYMIKNPFFSIPDHVTR